MLTLKINFTRILSSFAIVVIAVLIFSQIFTPAQAAIGINRQINFQGKLVNNPLSTNVTDTSYTVVFTLYDNASAGTALWTETQSVTTVDGIFRVALGSVTPFPANFNFNWSGLYLGIRVTAPINDPEMTPRIQMAAVPFAFNAEKVSGLTVQDTSGNASTSGTLQIANAKTVKFSDAFTTSGAVTLGSNTDNITLNTNGTTTLTLPTSGTVCTTVSCLASDPYWSQPAAGALGAGALFTNNSTVDFLIGSQASASAKFSITGLSDLNNQINASLSGQLIVMANKGWGGNATISGALTLGAFSNGVIQTTNNRSLTIGGATTGDIILSPANNVSGSNVVPGADNTSDLGLAAARWKSVNAAVYNVGASAGLATFTATCVTGVGGIVVTAATCPGSAPAYDLYWSQPAAGAAGAGALFTNNSTVDFLFGSQASTSAAFHLYGASPFQGTNPVASIGAKTSFAALVVDQTGVGDLFTASASGLPLFTITKAGLLDAVGNASIGATLTFKTNGGGQIQTSSNQLLTIGGNSTGQIKLSASNGTQSIVFAGYTTAGCTLKTDSTGLVTCGTDNTGSGGYSPFQELTGAIMPNNSTADFLVGGQSSTSAGFRVTGASKFAGTLSVASVSGKTSFAALVVDNSGVGDLITASASGATRFVIRQDGSVGIGTTGPNALLDVNGTASVSGTLTIGNGTTNQLRSAYGPLQLAYKSAANAWTTGLSLEDTTGRVIISSTQSTGTLFAVTNSTTLTGTQKGAYISLSGTNTGDTNVKTGLEFNVSSADPSYGANAANINDIVGTSSSWKVSGWGDLSITSMKTDINFFDSDAGTDYVIAGGDALTSNNTGGDLTVRAGYGLGGGGTGGNLFLSGGVAAGGDGYISLTTGGAERLNITSAGGFTVNSSAGTSSNCLKGGATAAWGTCGTGGGPFAEANGMITPNNSTEGLLIGGQSTLSASFKVYGTTLAGTNPVASISAKTSFAGLVVDQSGLGDVFTASTSGITRFTVNKNGYVSLGQMGVANGGLYFNSIGNGVLSAYIITDSNGNLILATTQANATVQVGSGNGNISLSLSNAADLLIADKTLTAGANYSGLDFQFKRAITGGSNTLNGAVLSVTDISSGTTTITPDLILGNAALTSGTFTGNLLRLQVNGLDRFVVGSTGIKPVASISAKTSFAALVIDNQGVGDLFTASASGTNKFVVKGNGSIIAPTYATCTLKTDANGLFTCGTDDPGMFTNVSGAIVAKNTTQDFLFGSQASASARFKLTANILGAGTLGVASISGQTSFAALVVDNSGVGDLFTASASGATRFTIRQNGSVGIGTNLPTEKLDVEGGNAVIGSQTNSITALTRVTQSTAGTYASGGTTGIASASAMAVYNGSLYVGTGKGGMSAGGAEVYRYDGTAGTWTRVSQSTPGTIAASGTSAIASVSAMTVFNGQLYIGTAKSGLAEVYRYDGGTTWTRVSTATSGTLQTTSGINAISSMVVMGGNLYVGTDKRSGAEVYRYGGNNTWTSLNSAAGTFIATGADAVDSLVAYNNTLYAGLKKAGANADVAKWGGGTTWARITSAAGTVCAANTYDVPAMAVYNGKLYISTVNTSRQANLCRYDDTAGAVSTSLTTVITATPGTIRNSGTSAITAIRSMTVYNGRLYIGTEKPAGAEVYQYIDGVDWIVLNTTAGTLASTAGVDAVSSLIQYNSKLLVGGSEINASGASAGSEVYEYTNITDESFALKFNANSLWSSATVQNQGAIWFMASPSGQVNTGNQATGSFMFSNGLITGAGAYDLAEDYPTRDDTIKPGDLVSISQTETGFVEKASKSYQKDIVGVYSENPGFRLSQTAPTINGGNVIPVALVGRVPVRVSTVNGEISPGDYLTSSPIAGVAMKATKAGAIIGKAMEGYSGEGIGKVLTFVTIASYNGDSIANSLPSLTSQSSDLAKTYLNMVAVNPQPVSDNTLSEIVTDRVAAGVEIMTPKVSANTIRLDEMQALTGLDVVLNLTSDGKFIIKNNNQESVVTFDSFGNASFSGTLTVDKLKANSIAGLDIISNRIDTLSQKVDILENLFSGQNGVQNSTSSAVLGASTSALFLSSLSSDGIATVSADLNVGGNSVFNGMLSVLHSISTPNLLVSDFASFFGDVFFKKNVNFEGRPTFNSDTAGFAVINKGSNSVEVNFDEEYISTPVVTASITLDQNADVNVQKQIEDTILNGNISYIITKRTTKSFVIKLNKQTDQDISFSWVALSIKNAKAPTTNSNKLRQNPTATMSAAFQSIINQLNN